MTQFTVAAALLCYHFFTMHILQITDPHLYGDAGGRLRGACVVVHAHPAEVMPEARFEKLARRGIERLAGRSKDLMYNAGHGCGSFARAGAAV